MTVYSNDTYTGQVNEQKFPNGLGRIISKKGLIYDGEFAVHKNKSVKEGFGR